MPKPIRALYSFPHKLGADRICTTAWYQARGLIDSGVELLVFPGAVTRPLPHAKEVRPTLARGRFRIPYTLLGTMRACAIHDYVVSRRLERLGNTVDIVHAWPLGSLRTLRTARRLGIPTLLERPNAHTRFAYDVVRLECERLGVALPPDHEHAYKEDVLRKEEAEYPLATQLLCPSDFVARTFLDLGFRGEQLARHQYGFDDQVYYPPSPKGEGKSTGLTMLFVGGCAPRKGLHYALSAWLASTACTRGEFLIAGQFVPGYEEVLRPMLSHPSVKVLGHRHDVPELMRRSDVLVLSTIEEGSALVTSEARGSGCVLLVSEAAGAICRHMENALVHNVGDVVTLTGHINRLEGDPALLQQLRTASLKTVPEATWNAAAKRLFDIYESTISRYRSRRLSQGPNEAAIASQSPAGASLR